MTLRTKVHYLFKLGYYVETIENLQQQLTKTNKDIYLNWNAFVPFSLERGTLRTVVQLACLVCSTETYLKEELTHLEKVFIEKHK